MTTIRYFIPEDGDDEIAPNVFLAPKPRQQGMPPTLRQVKESFPLPGKYHFRFKSPLVPGADREKSAMAVWMDFVNDQGTVPTWRNTIIAKVTRISMEDEEDDDDDADFNAVRRSAPTPARPPHPAPASAPAPVPAPVPPQAEPFLDVFDHGPSPSSSNHGATAAAPNLLDHHMPPHQAPVAAAASTSSVSSGKTLLDMDGPVYGNSQSTTAHNDFLGMTAPTPTPATPSPPVSGGFRPPPAATPQHSYGGMSQSQPTPQTMPRPPPNAQKPQGTAFDNFSSQQGPFGGLGTPWK